MAQAMECGTSAQALTWIRIALRTVLPALEPPEVRRACEWLAPHGQRQAARTLQGGAPVAFAVTARGLRVEWTARPVLFLPLAHRGPGGLPPCTARFACASREPGHRCGGAGA
jgi:hypothetical protein